MRLKLVLALLALGMIPVTFTSCGDDTPDKGFELISYLDGCRRPSTGRRCPKRLQSPSIRRICRPEIWF